MHLFEWEKERGQMGGRAEGEAESLLSTVPDTGSIPGLRSMVTRAEIMSRTLNWPSHPGDPTIIFNGEFRSVDDMYQFTY